VADVSHELRSPLTTLQGNLDLMRRYGHDPRGLEAMDEEMKRLAHLIQDLLMLAQADAGQIILNRHPINLTRLLQEVYDDALMKSKNQHRIEYTSEQDIFVLGDGDRLKQVFENIVGNAMQYTPPSGHITIELKRIDATAQVRISDNGIGIPDEDLEHVFDRFYRVDKARSRAAGGTGLGLSIAQWIVQAHTGKIAIQSEFKQGTTITISLPMSQPARKSDVATASK
jgi:signal transduction histidine kinase